MRSGTIQATEIWKRFRADARATYLQDEISRMVNRLKGRSGNGWRWVLRDIEIQAEPGLSVGLVGANGSGKSTLLKILTQVMYPTAGRVKVAGRVGSLIELRAGMPSRRGQRGSTHAYNLKEVRARERALSEQGELAYRQLVTDWHAKGRKRAGADAATGARL